MNLRLRTLLAGTFLALAGLAVLAALAMISLARDGEASASYLVDSVRSVESAERIALDLHELQHVGSAESDAAAQALVNDVAFNRLLIQSPAEEKIVIALEGEMAALLAARAEATRSESGRAKFELTLARTRDGQNALLQINLDQARGAEALTTQHGRKATRLAALAAALLIAAMGALLILVRNNLIRPLGALRENIQRLAMGESGVRTPERRAVELRELASTFNAMATLLDEQRRGRAEILGRVAGALEAPLASLRGQLERLSPGAPIPSEEEMRKLHAQIIRQSLQLEQRVVEFLDASRAEAGELPLQRAPCELRELVRESVELFRGVSPAHRFELTAPAPVTTIADQARLEQVLHALLALALRRAPGGGRIDVQVQARNGHAELSIAAIEAEAPGSFEAMFNDLRNLSVALRDVPGVLFGLDVSRKLIEAHRGHIEVDAQGTRFVVDLPLAESSDISLAAPATGPLAATL